MAEEILEKLGVGEYGRETASDRSLCETGATVQKNVLARDRRKKHKTEEFLLPVNVLRQVLDQSFDSLAMHKAECFPFSRCCQAKIRALQYGDMSDKSGNTHLIWHDLRRESVADAKVFSLNRNLRRSSDGRESWYYTLASPDWVNVVATTTDSEGRSCFVMVRQFRHGSMDVSLEFPGGVVDPGEEPITAARRELEEETGFSAPELVLVGSVNPNPALMDNRVFTYVATDVHRSGDQDLDHNEIIDVALIPTDRLADHAEEFDHAMMHVALRFYERRKNGADA